MNTPVLVMSISVLLVLLVGLVLLRRCQLRTIGRVVSLFVLIEWLSCSVGVVAMGLVWHPIYHFKVRPLLLVMGGCSILIWVLVAWPAVMNVLGGSGERRHS